MRVLTVTKDLKVGGTQRVAQNVAVGLKQRGHSSAVLAYAAGGVREAYLDAAEIPVFRPSDRNDTAAAIASAKSWHPDVIHIHRTGRPDPLETDLLRELKFSGAKVVETNVFGRYDWTDGGRLIDAHCNLTRWCDFKWRSWSSGAPARAPSFVVPNAVEGSSFSPLSGSRRSAARAKLGIPDELFLFGRVGQPLEDKWDARLIGCFHEVFRSHRDVGLLLVAPPPSVVRAVSLLPTEAQKVIFIKPPISDDSVLSDYFGILDCFAHMSRVGESFGLVLCEAMLSNVPVITLSTPLRDNSQIEVVRHNVDGLVAFHIKGFVRAMQEMVNGRAHGGAFPDIRRSVLDRYCANSVVARFTSLYDALLGESDLSSLPQEMLQIGDKEWVNSMLQAGVGPPMSQAEKAALALVHTPTFYRIYMALRP